MTQGRILYVEDEALWVADVRNALPELEVVHASTPAEARRLAAEETFALALVDLSLQGDEEAGLSLVRELGAQPGLKRIVLSGRKDPSSVKRSLQYGADDFVEKGTNLASELRAAVSRALTLSHGATGVQLQTVSLVHFKSWREQRGLALGKRLTLFLGSNSAGKSSVFQALLLLKQTAESADRALPLQIGGNQAQHVDLGTFQDIAFGHDTSRQISLGVTWAETGRALRSGFEATVALRDGRQEVQRLEFLRDGERYGMELSGSKYLVFAENASGVTSDVSFRPPIKCYGFPPEALTRLLPAAAEAMQDLQLSFERLMERIYYLQPLRERPARVYTWTGERPGSVGARGDRAIDALLAMDRDQERLEVGAPGGAVGGVAALSSLLSQLGLTRSVRLEQISSRQYEVRIVPARGTVEVGLADLGFGLSQVLPILVLGLYAPPGSVVLVEQPELHLHPAAQVGLGDVFIELARHRDLQFLVETHSEHLLLRLQRRIAEGVLDASDVRLYFCRRDEQGTVAEELQLNEYGEISNWPPEFFGDPTTEAAERIQAALRRRQQTTRT